MTDRQLEATQTVLEAMERTEAILRREAEVHEYRAELSHCPRRYRRGIGAWLAAWRMRVNGWTA